MVDGLGVSAGAGSSSGGGSSSSREGSLRQRKPAYTTYCMLGMGGNQDSETSRGYVPVPKGTAYTQPPDCRRLGPVRPPYVITADPKQLVTREKVSSLDKE